MKSCILKPSQLLHQHFKPIQLESNFSLEKKDFSFIIKIFNEMQECGSQLAISSRSKQIHMLWPWKSRVSSRTPPPPTPYPYFTPASQSLSDPSSVGLLCPSLGTRTGFSVLMRFSSSNSKEKTLLFIFSCRATSQVWLTDWLFQPSS